MTIMETEPSSSHKHSLRNPGQKPISCENKTGEKKLHLEANESW